MKKYKVLEMHKDGFLTPEIAKENLLHELILAHYKPYENGLSKDDLLNLLSQQMGHSKEAVDNMLCIDWLMETEIMYLTHLEDFPNVTLSQWFQSEFYMQIERYHDIVNFTKDKMTTN
jgi:predicted glycosyltransferase